MLRSAQAEFAILIRTCGSLLPSGSLKPVPIPPKKGQAEFAILIGILIIAAAIVVFTFAGTSPLSPPSALSVQQRQVREIVVREATEAGQLTLKRLEATGGSLGSQAGGAPYRGHLVNYWQACSSTAVPDLTTVIQPELSAGVATILKARLPAATANLGKPVAFDLSKLTVSSAIVDGKADLRITIPATLDSQPLDPTYTTAVPTNYKQLHAFAADLAAELAENRPYEQYTIASLYLSSLPTKGLLVGCGDHITITPSQLSNKLEAVASFVLANTYWWQPFRLVGPGEEKTYSIPTVSGKTYPFTPAVSFPDGFQLRANRPIIITNDEFLEDRGIFTVSQCVEVFDQEYSFSYPIVFSLHDTTLGTPFNLASYVSIKDMEPAARCALPTPAPEACALGCAAKLTVTNTAGQPLENVTGVYGSCILGTTDSSGTLESPVPCGSEELRLLPENDSYEFLRTPVPADALNQTFALWRRPTFNVSFRMAGLHGRCFASDSVTADCVPTAPLAPAPAADYAVCGLRKNSESENRFTLLNASSARSTHAYAVTNLQPLQQADLETEPGRQACSANPSSCFGSAADNTTVSYLPVGPATFDAELRLIALQTPTDPEDVEPLPRWVQGAIRTPVTLPEHDSNITITIPRAAEANVNDYTDAVGRPGRVREADRVRNRCGTEPVALSLPTNARWVLTRNNGCFTCGEARTALRQDPLLLSGADLSGLFTQQCRTEQNGTEPTTGQPISIDICTWLCDPVQVRSTLNATRNIWLEDLCV